MAEGGSQDNRDGCWQADKDVLQCNLEMFQSGLMADVEFKVGQTPEETETIRAHKYVLVSRCPVFEAMFTANMKESLSNKVTIKDMDPDAFREFLRFLYVGEAKPNNATIIQLYYASRKYILPMLEKSCTTFLNENLTDLNVFDLLDHCAGLYESDLTGSCVTYIANRFSYLSKTEAFLGISRPSLLALLACNSLDLPEEDIYLSCIKWASEKLTQRRKNITDSNIRKELGGALKLIRFPAMLNVAFAVLVGEKNVLTPTEKNSIYNYLIAKKFHGNDKQVNGFSTIPRKWRFSASRVDTLDLLGPICLASTKSLYLSFMAEAPIILKGLSILGTESPGVIESISCVISNLSIDLPKKQREEKTRLVKDVFSPGGKALIPVFFDKPLALCRYVEYTLQVQIEAPNIKRYSLKIPEVPTQPNHLKWNPFHFYWRPLRPDGSDPIPQLLFTPIMNK